VVRDEIPRYSVDLHFMIRPGIGYMHVTGFNETTEHEVADALDQMGDLKGLILDLRQNPGGLLTEGVGVADKFLRKGQLIVSHHGRASAEKRSAVLAKKASASRSRANCSRTLGRKILTATRTGGVSLVWARWTWAIDAAAKAPPKLENRASTGLPKASTISARASFSEKGGKRS